ncbi:MAG: hypothetical protein SOW08_14800, partial [Lachnospiraceae bacterium]|nr:hypothetical protein [Lachnospiraceae bacterium]
THEEHLSVLDYKKQERAREVGELEAQKTTFEAINQILQEQMVQAEGELQELKKTVIKSKRKQRQPENGRNSIKRS